MIWTFQSKFDVFQKKGCKCQIEALQHDYHTKICFMQPMTMLEPLDQTRPLDEWNCQIKHQHEFKVGHQCQLLDKVCQWFHPKPILGKFIERIKKSWKNSQFWVNPRPRQSLGFPRQSLGFPRQSLGLPRQNLAPHMNQHHQNPIGLWQNVFFRHWLVWCPRNMVNPDELCSSHGYGEFLTTRRWMIASFDRSMMQWLTSLCGSANYGFVQKVFGIRSKSVESDIYGWHISTGISLAPQEVSHIMELCCRPPSQCFGLMRGRHGICDFFSHDLWIVFWESTMICFACVMRMHTYIMYVPIMCQSIQHPVLFKSTCSRETRTFQVVALSSPYREARSSPGWESLVG